MAETRLRLALSKLEGALNEEREKRDRRSRYTPAEAVVPSAPGAARGASVFSFDQGSPFSVANPLVSNLGALATHGATATEVVVEEEEGRTERGSVQRCRPYNRADLLARIATYRSMTWFAKPFSASPTACARRGWVNTDVDVLKCNACNAELEAPRSLSSWTPEACVAFSAALDETHAALCPWRGTAAPASLVALALPAEGPAVNVTGPWELAHDRSQALARLRGRFLSFKPGSGSPAMPLLNDSFGRELQAAATYCGDASTSALLGRVASAADLRGAQTPRGTTALQLALAGWLWEPAEAGARAQDARLSKGVLTCAETGRAVGLWHYTLDGGDAGDKRQREEGDPFHPTADHDAYSPWVEQVAVASEDGDSEEVPMWVVYTALLVNGTSRRARAEPAASAPAASADPTAGPGMARKATAWLAQAFGIA